MRQTQRGRNRSVVYCPPCQDVIIDEEMCIRGNKEKWVQHCLGIKMC